MKLQVSKVAMTYSKFLQELVDYIMTVDSSLQALVYNNG